jgi:hypothetical protein
MVGPARHRESDRAPGDDHHRHEPDSLWVSAVRATLHCLTGCAIGEVAGMVLAAAFALGNAASITLSMVLAFVLTVPVNRLLIARGKGHAVMHEIHAH